MNLTNKVRLSKKKGLHGVLQSYIQPNPAFAEITTSPQPNKKCKYREQPMEQSIVVGLITFCLGLILGHRLALGRDLRKEFNEITNETYFNIRRSIERLYDANAPPTYHEENATSGGIQSARAFFCRATPLRQDCGIDCMRNCEPFPGSG